MKLPNVISEGFLQAMPAEERAKLGRAGMTSSEAMRVFNDGEERKLQGVISNWLLLNKHYFIRPRMDKKTTVARGTPDFIVCIAGRFVCIEAKTKHGKLSEDQENAMSAATASGAIYCVARSLEDVIRVIAAITLNINTDNKAL